MQEADPVQGKLEQITQQMIHVVQACNKEKEIIEDKSLAVQQDLEIVEGRSHTEKAKIDGELSGVGGEVHLQQAIIEEMRAGITILQSQDNVIVQEARSIFQGIHKQVADMIKQQPTQGSTLLNHKKAIVTLQEETKNISRQHKEIFTVIEGIQEFLKEVPTWMDLLKHMKAMDETLQKIREVNTGLTTHMESYEVSESTSHRTRSVHAGPSNIHPSRYQQVRSEGSFISSDDTEIEASYQYGNIRGGNVDGNGDNDGDESEDPHLPGPQDSQGPPGPPEPPGPSGTDLPECHR